MSHLLDSVLTSEQRAACTHNDAHMNDAAPIAPSQPAPTPARRRRMDTRTMVRRVVQLVAVCCTLSFAAGYQLGKPAPKPFPTIKPDAKLIRLL